MDVLDSLHALGMRGIGGLAGWLARIVTDR